MSTPKWIADVDRTVYGPDIPRTPSTEDKLKALVERGAELLERHVTKHGLDDATAAAGYFSRAFRASELHWTIKLCSAVGSDDCRCTERNQELDALLEDA